VPIFVRGDPVRLTQLVSNLLNNAAKYVYVGGRIAVSVVQDDREVVLRVTDTGVGIPEHMLQRVFEPFTQVDRSRDGALGGLGLGLSLVKRLAQLHDGTVEAYSDGPGLGSEFVVRFPALHATSSPGLLLASNDSRAGSMSHGVDVHDPGG
jgi:signal transduction histidine kinase